MWCWPSSPAQRTPSWTSALAPVCPSPVTLAAQQMVCTSSIKPWVQIFVQFLDPTSFAFEASENIINDVSPPSAGLWEQIVPEDKQWVNAGEFLGFSGKIVYRWESVNTDTESNINLIKSDNLDALSVSDMDAADASSLGKRYHLEYFGYRPTFYDIGNTCTKEQAGMTITAVIHVRKNK